MHVYIKNKTEILFFVNYKCAFSTFEKMRAAGIVSVYKKEVTNNFIVYLICRDPYKRLESFYKDKFHKGMNESLPQTCQKQLLKYFPREKLVNKQVSFEEFVGCLQKGYQDAHIELQTMHRVKPHHIIKLEDGLGKLMPILGANPDNFFENDTDDIKVDLTWTEEMRTIVNELYLNDFIKLKYDMF